MTLVLSKSELDRMRAMVEPDRQDNSQTIRKQQLKKLSEDKVKNWPNTLEAMRKKKENFIKERAEQDELRKQDIDREEAEMRRTQRLEAIGKANELLYEQTDKMKLLRSQMLYADIIETRVSQIDHKQLTKEQEKLRDAKFHEEVLRQVAAGEELEKQKIAKQQQKIEEVKIARKQQRDEVRSIKEEAELKVKSIGLQMKREIQDRVEEDAREYELKKRLAAENNLRMLRANEELKGIRFQMKEQDRIADEERNQEILKIENRKLELKKLEKLHFAQSQETRQKMIDAAVKKLSETANVEQTILEQQMQNLQDKEDRLIAEKKAKNEQFRSAIADSRIAQIEARERKKKQQYDDEIAMVAKFRAENEIAIKQEAEKVEKAKAETIRIKKMQYDDGQEMIRRKQEEKLIEIEQARFLTSIQGNDDARFIELCKQEIERSTKLGKPVYTLLRALQYDQPQLLPAPAIKENGRKKKE